MFMNTFSLTLTKTLTDSLSTARGFNGRQSVQTRASEIAALGYLRANRSVSEIGSIVANWATASLRSDTESSHIGDEIPCS